MRKIEKKSLYINEHKKKCVSNYKQKKNIKIKLIHLHKI